LIYNRTCTIADYELWAPSNGKTNVGGLSCLLGKDITYRRRNQTAQCFYAENLDPIASTKYCPCTEDDWECDLGFERDSNSNCIYPGGSPTYPPQVCPVGETYNKTKGYRAVAATACQGGVDHSAEGPFDCPSPGISGQVANYGWVAAVVIVGLVVVCIIGSFVAIRSEWVRDKVPFVKRLHGWKVGYFGMQNAPDTIGEEFEPNDGGDDEGFSIGGDEEDSRESVSKQLDDSFNPRG